MAEVKLPGRGKGPWTAKGVQAGQEERIADLELQVEAISAALAELAFTLKSLGEAAAEV
jgi:hypothetical protein